MNTSDDFGRTILHCICMNTHMTSVADRVELVELFLRRGADVNACAAVHNTPLYIAAKQGHTEVVRALLRHGANVNAKVELGKTALHIAAYNGWKATIETLVEHGADIDCRDVFGMTSLHYACREGRAEIIQVLLDHGADLNVTDAGNKTPTFYVLGSLSENLLYCARNVYEDCYHLLKEHIVKLTVANLDVSRCSMGTLYNAGTLCELYEECEQEVRALKEEKAGHSRVSLYDIVTGGTHKVARYARNRSVVEVLTAGDYKLRFPIYARFVENSFRRGQKRSRLMDVASQALCQLCGYSLPELLSFEVLGFLGDKDIENLIAANV